MSLTRLGAGDDVVNPRDKGWSLRDSEAWCRCRYCRLAMINDLVVPDRSSGVMGCTCGLEGRRCTLAFAPDGRRFLIEDDWRVHDDKKPRLS